MELPLFLLNAVLFPGATLPLHIFEERYKLLISNCLDREEPFGVILIRSGSEVGELAEPFDIGTTARIAHVRQLEEGRLNVICVGGQRFRTTSLQRDQPYLVGEVELLKDVTDEDGTPSDLADTVGYLFAEYYRLCLNLSDQWTRSVNLPRGTGTLSDFVASRLAVSLPAKQQLLETLSVRRRLEMEKDILGDAIRDLTSQLSAARGNKYRGFGTLC